MSSITTHPVIRERDILADYEATAYVGEVDYEIPMHSHDYVEIVLIGGGRGIHLSEQGPAPIGAGSFVVVVPGAVHGFSDCHGLITGFTYLPHWLMDTEYESTVAIPALVELVSRRPSSAGAHGVYSGTIAESAATRIIRRMGAFRTDAHEQPTNRALLLGHILTIIGDLLAATPAEAAEHEIHPAVADVLARVDEDPGHNWSLEELARVAFVDPRHLSRQFRQHLGVTPMAYVARVRATRAAAMLSGTEDPISRIGSSVGWPDPAHFSRRFRELSGLSPSEYRRRLANKPTSSNRLSQIS